MLYVRPTQIDLPDYLPETSKKAKDLYSRMSIWFDDNFYREDRDGETCFKYMYFIYHMLACKKRFFASSPNAFEKYDEFATYAANTIYIRFLKKQANGERVKSLLNYAKGSINHLVYDFRQLEYRDITYLNDNKSAKRAEVIADSLKYQAESQVQEQKTSAIKEELQNVSLEIKKLLDKSPYKNNCKMYRRLYISCLISIIKSITLNNKNAKTLSNKNLTTSYNESLKLRMYRKEGQDSITLWHLDESLTDYIRLLCNQVKSTILNNIKEVEAMFTLDDETVNSIVQSTWESSTHSDYANGEISDYAN